MKRNLRLILLCALFLTIGVFAEAQVKTVTPPKTELPKTTAAEKPTAKDYQILLDKLKKGDLTIDFRKLRFAFAETANYSTAGSDATERNKMFDALNAKNFKEALRLAEIALEKNYTNLNNHFIAFAAHQELGGKEKSEFHKAVLNKLLASITLGNDGATTKTAFEVIVVEEERDMLRFLGYTVTAQQLIKQDGHQYDLLTATHRTTKEPAKFYFNVDKVFEGYDKMFAAPKK